MKYIDADKLTKAIEDKGLDCSFALKMERLDILALIDSLRESEDKRRAEELIKALQRGYYDGYQHGKEDAQKEQKSNIELIQKSWYMEGYHDKEFNCEPKWIIKTGEGGPRYEENPKYGQIIEQKPVEYLSKDKVYAIMNKLTELSTSELIPLNSDEYKKINEITSDVRSLLDYPIGQKPVDYAEELKKCKDNPLYFYDKYVKVKQKPAEWSKEDEKMLQSIIKDFRAGKVSTIGQEQWLKFLRPQQKKEEL